ncbi:hypothetical protein MHYP_G00354060 [Metynnis hypsauchen]
MVGGLATGPFHKHHVCQPHRHDNADQATTSSLCKSWRTNAAVVLTVRDDPPARPPLPRARRVLVFTPISSDCPLSINESAESPGEEEQGSAGLPQSGAFVWGSGAPPLAPPPSALPQSLLLKNSVIRHGEKREALGGTWAFSAAQQPLLFLHPVKNAHLIKDEAFASPFFWACERGGTSLLVGMDILTGDRLWPLASQKTQA